MNDIIDQIDEFRSFFLKVRSRFPYMSETAIGLTSFSPPAYYKNHGIDLEIQLTEPVTVNVKDENNAIAHFINQNFILRLYAILNYYGFVSESISLKKESPGFLEVDLLRRLRNIYAHSIGKYNSDNDDHVKLREVMTKRFGINIIHYDEFPLNIDEVLDEIIAGCKLYIKHNY